MTQIFHFITEVGLVAQNVDRLQRQLAAMNKRQDDVGELVEYVEIEKSLSKQKAQAGLTTRVKWLVWGMPDED